MSSKANANTAAGAAPAAITQAMASTAAAASTEFKGMSVGPAASPSPNRRDPDCHGLGVAGMLS